MFRTLVTATFCVAALSISASADLFTTHLDEIQMAVEQRQEELPDKLTRAQKKEAAAYKSVLRKMSKDSVSLKTDLKVAKVSLKLERFDDPQLNGLLDSALTGFTSDIQAHVDSLQMRLDLGAPAKKSRATPAKAQKALDKATTRLDQATGEERRKRAVARLLQANTSARKAAKLLDKLGFTGDPGGGDPGGGDPGGGDPGGGDPGTGECGGTRLGPNDAASGMFGAGAQWSGEEYSIDTSGAQTIVTIFDCDEFDGRQYKFTLPAGLAPGEYDALATGSSLEVSAVGGSGTPISSGMVRIVEAGARLTVSYTFNGGVSYQGGFSIPLNE